MYILLPYLTITPSWNCRPNNFSNSTTSTICRHQCPNCSESEQLLPEPYHHTTHKTETRGALAEVQRNAEAKPWKMVETRGEARVTALEKREVWHAFQLEQETALLTDSNSFWSCKNKAGTDRNKKKRGKTALWLWPHLINNCRH